MSVAGAEVLPFAQHVLVQQSSKKTLSSWDDVLRRARTVSAANARDVLRDATALTRASPQAGPYAPEVLLLAGSYVLSTECADDTVTAALELAQATVDQQVGAAEANMTVASAALHVVVAALLHPSEFARRSALAVAESSLRCRGAVLPATSAILQALIVSQSDRSTFADRTRQFIEDMDTQVCLGQLYTKVAALLARPGLPAQLWSVQYMGHNWDRVVQAQRVRDGDAWAPASTTAFLRGLENCFAVRDTTLSLLVLDLVHLALPAAVLPSGSVFEQICRLVLQQMLAPDESIRKSASRYVCNMAEVAFDEVARIIGDTGVLVQRECAEVLVPEILSAYMMALAHEPQQSLATSGAVRVLQQIRTEHQAVFYGPLLLAIKSSVVDVARAAMLSLRTCLAVLPASVVMPKDILAASLAQPCSLGMLCLLHELRVHVELYRASRCKLMDSDVALALFEDWERGLSAFMRSKTAAKSVIPSAVKIMACKLLFSLRKFCRASNTNDWVGTVLAWATAEPTEVDDASHALLCKTYEAPDALPRPASVMPMFGNAYAYAVAQSDPALSVERGFDDTWVEPSTDLRTAAVMLLDVISPMLGEHELRQLVPIAWKLLLHGDEATVRVAGHLITLCAHVTPQYAQRAILGDLYSEDPAARLGAVRALFVLWQLRASLSTVFRVSYQTSYSPSRFPVMEFCAVESEAVHARQSANDATSVVVHSQQQRIQPRMDLPLVLGAACGVALDLQSDTLSPMSMMGARLLVTNAVASEPRLFLRSLFDVLMYEDYGELARSTSRLASAVLLNCERPAFASALLHNMLLSRARVVVGAQEAAHVIVQCLPLLAELYASHPWLRVPSVVADPAAFNAILPQMPGDASDTMSLGARALVYAAKALCTSVFTTPEIVTTVMTVLNRNFLQPVGTPTLADTSPAVQLCIEAWLMCCVHVTGQLPASFADAEDIVYGAAVLIENQSTCDAVARGALALLASLAVRCPPFFASRGLALCLPVLLRTLQTSDNELVKGSTQFVLHFFLSAFGDAALQAMVTSMRPSILCKRAGSFQPDQAALFGALQRICSGDQPADPLSIEASMSAPLPPNRTGPRVADLLRYSAVIVGREPHGAYATAFFEFVALVGPSLCRTPPDAWATHVHAALAMYDNAGKKMPVDLAALDATLRVNALRACASLSGSSEFFVGVLSQLLPLCELQLSTDAVAGTSSIAWYEEVLRATLGVTRSSLPSVAGLHARALEMVAKITSAVPTWAHLPRVYRLLRDLGRANYEALMKAEFVQYVVQSLLRRTLAADVAAEATALLAQLLCNEPVLLFDAAMTGHAVVDVQRALLLVLLPVAMCVSSMKYASEALEKRQTEWMLAVLRSALWRSDASSAALSACKAVLLVTRVVSSSALLGLAVDLLKVLRKPPAEHRHAVLAFIEFVCGARPAVFPFLAAHLRSIFASVKAWSAEERVVVERAEELLWSEHAPPSAAEWHELVRHEQASLLRTVEL